MDFERKYWIDLSKDSPCIHTNCAIDYDQNPKEMPVVVWQEVARLAGCSVSHHITGHETFIFVHPEGKREERMKMAEEILQGAMFTKADA